MILLLSRMKNNEHCAKIWKREHPPSPRPYRRLLIGLVLGGLLLLTTGIVLLLLI